MDRGRTTAKSGTRAHSPSLEGWTFPLSMSGVSSPFTVTESDTCPISSWTFRAFACSADYAKPLDGFALKPLLLDGTVNLLGAVH